MDYTAVFRPLIYKEREDIDDFPVDETDDIKYLTMETVFMGKLEARPFIKENYNAPELILMIFNNARFITTLIWSENHPQHYLHKYLKIAENKHIDGIMHYHAMPATMALVVNYLLHYMGKIYYGSKIVKAIINYFEDWDMKGRSEGKKDFVNLLVDKTSETDTYPKWVTDIEFERRDIREVVTDYSIDDIEFTGYGLDYVISELFGLCTDIEVKDYLVLLKNRIMNFERTAKNDGVVPEMIEDAYTKLKKAFSAARIQWEEASSSPCQIKPEFGNQEIKSPLTNVVEVELDPDIEIMQGQIDDLKDEVNQLLHKNEILKEKLDSALFENDRMKKEQSRITKIFGTHNIALTNNSNFARVVQAMVSARYFKRANGDDTNATEVGSMLLKLFGVSNTWKSVLQKAFSRENPLKTFDELRDAGEDYWSNRMGLTEDIRKKGKK